MARKKIIMECLQCKPQRTYKASEDKSIWYCPEDKHIIYQSIGKVVYPRNHKIPDTCPLEEVSE